MPPDKAICHRVVLASALAAGETAIAPWPDADDCQRTLDLVKRLGVTVRCAKGRVTVTGVGAAGLRAPDQELPCGESGTTLRLAAGVLAGQAFPSTLSAGPALSRRPMRRIAEPLTQMGARIEGRTMGRAELCPPLTIRGTRPLRAIRYELPVASAQVKSAVLFAGLYAEGRTTVIEPQSTRDHTERALSHFGAMVHRSGTEVSVEPGSLTSPGSLALPGDFSSAAFFIVAALCVPGSKITLNDVSLNPTRTGLLTVLERMGARITTTVTDQSWEPRGTITVDAGSLRAVTLEAREVPSVIDEVPILMVAAACAQGRSIFQGLAELRVKETDRIRSMVEGLQRLGVRIRVEGSETVDIEGGALTGETVDAAGDHRTAMSLAVAGLVARGAVTIQGAECVAKSFPAFFDQLRFVTGSTTVKTVDNAKPLC